MEIYLHSTLLMSEQNFELSPEIAIGTVLDTGSQNRRMLPFARNTIIIWLKDPASSAG